MRLYTVKNSCFCTILLIIAQTAKKINTKIQKFNIPFTSCHGDHPENLPNSEFGSEIISP